MATSHYLANCAGKECCSCAEPCEDEKNLPCSPDCDLLGKDKSIDIKKCLAAGCDAYEF